MAQELSSPWRLILSQRDPGEREVVVDLSDSTLVGNTDQEHGLPASACLGFHKLLFPFD